MSLLFLSRTVIERWFAASCFAVAATLATSSQAVAQGGTPATIRLQPEDLERGQYGPQHNFYFLPPGITGENYVSAGYFGQKLRPYLGHNEQALAQLDKYKTNKALYLADRALLVGSVIGYGVQVFGNGNTQYASPGQLVAGGLFVTSLVATLFINKHTNEYVQQAVDDYNTDLPGDTSHRRGSLRQLRPTTYGLAATSHGQPLLALSWKIQ